MKSSKAPSRDPKGMKNPSHEPHSRSRYCLTICRPIPLIDSCPKDRAAVALVATVRLFRWPLALLWYRFRPALDIDILSFPAGACNSSRCCPIGDTCVRASSQQRVTSPSNCYYGPLTRSSSAQEEDVVIRHTLNASAAVAVNGTTVSVPEDLALQETPTAARARTFTV